MIIIQDGLKNGDIVYASFTPFKEVSKNKTTKKPIEVEYKISEYTKDYLRLVSTGGDYSIFFDGRTIELFNGNIRKQ